MRGTPGVVHRSRRRAVARERRDHPLHRQQHHDLGPGAGRRGRRAPRAPCTNSSARRRRTGVMNLGAILTAMITPFDERGDARSGAKRSASRAGWSIATTTGWSSPDRPAKGRRSTADERIALWTGGEGSRRRATRRSIANAGTNATRESVAAARRRAGGRRRRDSRRRSVLQQADAERNARALRRDRRSDAAAGRRLQHPGPHRAPTCCPRRCSSSPRRHAQSRRRQRVERRPEADRHDPARPRRAGFSSGPATITCSCRVSRWAPTASSASRRICARASTAECSTRYRAGRDRRSGAHSPRRCCR